MPSANKKLLLHSELRCLSRGKALTWVFESREQLGVFTEHEEQVTNMTSISHLLSQANISLLGKGSDIVKPTNKINALKIKNFTVEKNALSRNLAIFLTCPGMKVFEMGA